MERMKSDDLRFDSNNFFLKYVCASRHESFSMNDQIVKAIFSLYFLFVIYFSSPQLLSLSPPPSFISDFICPFVFPLSIETEPIN